MADVSLVAACDDPRLLGFTLWPRQRDLLADAERNRINVWALGRRSGKSTLAALTLLHDCLLRPRLQRHVRSGERRYAVAVATNLRQARLVVSAARSIVERSPALRPLIETMSDDEIRFKNETALTAFPCTSRGGRGWPISCIAFDEAAHFVDTEGNSAAESVWRSLVPSTAQFGTDGRIIVSSTPWGTTGLFADLFEQASRGELRDAAASTFTSAEMNPTIDAALLDAEQARDPETFKSEYEARFEGSGGSYIDSRSITACVADRGELRPEDGTRWVGGLDPAFSSDPFGVAIVGRDLAHHDRLLVGAVRAWKPQRAESFESRRNVEDLVLGEVAQLCARYGAHGVSDQYAARPIVDALRTRGVYVRVRPMTSTSKSEAFAALRARIVDGSIELPDHPDLLAELRRLRTRYSAGHASVVNPRVSGSHGDLAQAVALAVAEHDRHGRASSSSGVVFGSERSTITEQINPYGTAGMPRELAAAFNRPIRSSEDF